MREAKTERWLKVPHCHSPQALYVALSALVLVTVKSCYSCGSDQVCSRVPEGVADRQIQVFQSKTGIWCASYAGSNALAKQIENGAPADLFLSADEEWMDHLAARSWSWR